MCIRDRGTLHEIIEGVLGYGTSAGGGEEEERELHGTAVRESAKNETVTAEASGRGGLCQSIPSFAPFIISHIPFDRMIRRIWRLAPSAPATVDLIRFIHAKHAKRYHHHERDA